MTLLDAHKVLSAFPGGPAMSLLVGMSGTADPLKLFVRAAGAKRGRSVNVRALPFNTLAQSLHAPSTTDVEVFVLLPWDFVRSADWRSGFPARATNVDALRAEARDITDLLARRQNARVLYLPAPIPPLTGHPAENAAVVSAIMGCVASLNARVLPDDAFSLGMYLASGCPFGGKQLANVAEAVVESVLSEPSPRRKVLVTDLDNVLWAGAVAEDGLDGIKYGPEGIGFKHFIFQTLLKKLKGQGVLLCAVSRNDSAVALEALRGGRMHLAEEDFVAVLASYHAKSVQIEQLARHLNLGLDSCVFVDDNPVELAEVSSRLVDVTCIQFPNSDESLPTLCDRIAGLFPSCDLTPEDEQRTELYRRRLASLVPDSSPGSDLTGFLSGLDMKLTIHDRSTGDRTRAVQLINKTNQFNLNGRRLTDNDVARELVCGGRLYTASLEDRHGTHGEILACLISCDGLIRSFVLSCRVFQRRIEHAFLAWVASLDDPPRELAFAATPRNEPIQQFLADPAFETRADGRLFFDPLRFADEHQHDVLLFRLDVSAALSPAV